MPAALTKAPKPRVEGSQVPAATPLSAVCAGLPARGRAGEHEVDRDLVGGRRPVDRVVEAEVVVTLTGLHRVPLHADADAGRTEVVHHGQGGGGIGLDLDVVLEHRRLCGRGHRRGGVQEAGEQDAGEGEECSEFGHISSQPMGERQSFGDMSLGAVWEPLSVAGHVLGEFAADRSALRAFRGKLPWDRPELRGHIASGPWFACALGAMCPVEFASGSPGAAGPCGRQTPGPGDRRELRSWGFLRRMDVGGPERSGARRNGAA